MIRKPRHASGWRSWCVATMLVVLGLTACADPPPPPGDRPGTAAVRELRLTWPEDPRTSMSVQWRTERSRASVLVVAGPDGQWQQRSGGPPAPRTVTDGHLHQVRLTGLRPATEYRYAVTTDSGMSRPYSFRTAPDGPASFTFAGFADQGDCKTFPPACRVIEQIAQGRHAFVLGAGDLHYGDIHGVDAEQRWLRSISAYTATTPLMPVAGNHEYPEGNPNREHDIPLSDLQAHFDIPGLAERGYYSFDYGGVHVVALPDHYALRDGAADPALLEWLERDLAAARADAETRWVIAFLHRPLFSTGLRHGPDPAFARDLVPVLERHRVDVVLSGHEHNYERTLPMRGGVATSTSRDEVARGTGTTYVVSGGGGARTYDFGPPAPWDADRESVNHHVVFEVSPEALRLRAVGLDAAEIDSVTIRAD